MILAKFLEHNDIIQYGVIVNEKDNPRKDRLNLIQDRVNQTYLEYLSSFNLVCDKANSEFHDEAMLKADLLHCYSSPTTTFRLIRGKIFEIQNSVLTRYCPYCLLNKPTTLDHYIPESEFPEFSILNRNLIPCCKDCNFDKGIHWRNANYERRIIHFYNDDFINTKFLHGKIVWTSNDPYIIFQLKQPNSMPQSQFNTINNHFNDLRLLEKYEEKAIETFSVELGNLENYYQSNLSDDWIKNTISKTKQLYAKDFGQNYWLSVLYETLENHI